MGLLRGVDDSRLHRHNLEVEGLRTSGSGWGNRWGNETLASAVFPNETNSLGRRFVSHQPPHRNPLAHAQGLEFQRSQGLVVSRLKHELACDGVALCQALTPPAGDAR
jgi:hypothetical protein